MVEVGGGVAAKISPPMVGLGLGDGLGVQLPGYRFKVVDEEGDEACATAAWASCGCAGAA